jgi:hypothetical protein
MIGYGCRAQGKPVGTVLIVTAAYQDNETAFNMLSASKCMILLSRTEQLKVLADALPYVENKMLKKIKQIFEGTNWQIDFLAFLKEIMAAFV